MLPSWERILYFHIQPALIDAMLSLGLVLLLLRLFRVRNPSIRAFFLFIPLVRPLIILLEGGAWTERLVAPSMFLGVRIPDPFNLIPTDITDAHKVSTISQLIGFLLAIALIAALAFLALRWSGFLIFYRRLRRRSSAISPDDTAEAELGRTVVDMSDQMGLKRPPEILLSHERWMTPSAIGWRHPALIIDRQLLDELDPADLRLVLAHELSHIRRRDGLWHWVSVLLRDVQAFNPFSHLSISRMGLEREKACDRDAVEFLKVPPQMLAECLVKVATLTEERHSQPLPGYGMGLVRKDFGALKSRINYLLSMESGEFGHKKKPGAGWMKKSALMLVWLLMIGPQVYLCLWLGEYALVIK